MIVRSGTHRRRGMGVPYWDLPAANRIGYWSLPGGIMPTAAVAAANGGPPIAVPMAAPARRIPPRRAASGPILTGGAVVRRGLRGYVRRGLGDCGAPGPDGITCPDGSEFSGELGGFAQIYAPSSTPVAAPPAPAPSSNPLTSLFASILPASFTTLQEAIAQPGQVVKTPTTLITGSGTNIASIPGLSTLGSSSLSGLLIPALLIGGAVLLFSSSKK